VGSTAAADGKVKQAGDKEISYDGDKLLVMIGFYITPVTATSSRVIFRSQALVAMSGIKGWIAQNIPAWFNHIFVRSTILDGDMVFLNRQSMELMHGELTWKDYFMPAPADLTMLELWRHFDKYSPNGINFYPHEVENEALPQEQLLDRYEQHVKNCKYCSGALRSVRAAMWAALGVAVVGMVAVFATSVTCVVVSGTKCWQVGLGGLIVSGIALKLWQFLKGLELKFMFEPYIHQDKN
jgi:pheophorbide a oxygenase